MQDVVFFLKKYLKELIFALLLCLCLTLACFSIFIKSKPKENTDYMNLLAKKEVSNEEEASEKVEEKKMLHVDLKGAIKNPGVYEVEEGSIIRDVITLAGGTLDDAATDDINMSKKVSDEMVIYIYTKKEKNEISKENNKTPSKPQENEVCNTTSYNIEDCVEKKESIITPSDTNNEKESEEENSLVNINTASKDKLMELNGIGEVKASAIITYRNTNGKFQKIEDILNVSGIGDAVFSKIKDFITV